MKNYKLLFLALIVSNSQIGWTAPLSLSWPEVSDSQCIAFLDAIRPKKSRFAKFAPRLSRALESEESKARRYRFKLYSEVTLLKDHPMSDQEKVNSVSHPHLAELISEIRRQATLRRDIARRSISNLQGDLDTVNALSFYTSLLETPDRYFVSILLTLISLHQINTENSFYFTFSQPSYGPEMNAQFLPALPRWGSTVRRTDVIGPFIERERKTDQEPFIHDALRKSLGLRTRTVEASHAALLRAQGLGLLSPPTRCSEPKEQGLPVAEARVEELSSLPDIPTAEIVFDPSKQGEASVELVPAG